MSNSSVPLLSAHSITKSFGPRTARHQVLFDVSADEKALQTVKELGYMQAPVVIAGDDHWSGFRPDKISQLAALATA